MIEMRLDVMMAERRVKLIDLAQQIGLTNANLSILKTGKARAIRLETLDALCKALDCQPGDLLRYVEDAGEDG